MNGRPHRGAWIPPAARRGLLVALAVLATAPAAAQVVHVQAGTSRLFGAHGGTATVRGGTFTTSVAAGVLDGRFTMGFLATKAWRGLALSAGDEAVDFQLPTDVFGGARYVPVRGAGVGWQRDGSRLRAIAGATSETLGAPFFRGAIPERPVGLLFYERRLSDRWRLFSNTALSRRQTSIHGLSYAPAPYLVAAAAGGVGNDEPYAATSAVLTLPRVDARAAFIRQRQGFRRIETASPTAAEANGANASVAVRPAEWWSVSAARQTFAGQPHADGRAREATVHQAGGSVNLLGVRVVGALYGSRQPRGRNVGTSLSVGRRLGRAVDMIVDYTRSDPGDGAAAHGVMLRLQETLGPRLSLIEVLSRANGQTSFNLGGEFLSNPVRASVNYQTVFAPLREGNPFVQVVGVDLRFNLLDRVDLHAGTYVTPAGDVRYSVSGSFLHAAAGGGFRRKASAIPRYVIRGRVRDLDDRPVPGAVLALDDDIVITDDEGRFFLRSARAVRRTLTVLADEFLTPYRVETVSAPAVVAAAPEADATEVIVRIRRL